MADDDLLHRFIFDNSDVRGEIISLSDSYRSVLANGDYPDAINRLLGELLAAAGLLSATMKFDGVFSLQARGDGILNLLMADCTRQNALRGIARLQADTELTSTDLASLLGSGHLAITIDPIEGERYQGIVPLEKGSLSGCLEDYFALSEQLPTRLWLFADGKRAAGLLLQALPLQTQSREQRDSYWQHLCVLADTLTSEEMLSLSNATVLHRLFHEEPLRLFEPRHMQFACSCSESRTADMLVSLGRDEVQSILDEQGMVSVQCQFCHQQYLFNQTQIDVLFAPQRTLH